MLSKARSHSSHFGMHWSPANTALTLMVMLLFLIFLFLFIFLTAQPVQGQLRDALRAFAGVADKALVFPA